jgi:UDP-GlcNAc3NAcA epimerase
VHVEAGLRSFNKAMPEEVNRIACDHMSTLLFTPTKTGLDNLMREGFSENKDAKATANQPKIYQCGDVMFDNSLYFSNVSASNSTLLADLGLIENQYVLTTIHRDSNTDIAENMTAIFQALFDIQQATNLTIVLPIHPRTKSKMEAQLPADLLAKISTNAQFKIIPPAGFIDIIALEKNARMIITDSGGLQKEAYFFQKPCVILRPQTEWVEIVSNGNALLAGSDYQKIVAGFNSLLAKSDFSYPPLYGDGHAAEFICQKILEDL